MYSEINKQAAATTAQAIPQVQSGTGQKVLRDINLSIPRGQTVAVIATRVPTSMPLRESTNPQT